MPRYGYSCGGYEKLYHAILLVGVVGLLLMAVTSMGIRDFSKLPEGGILMWFMAVYIIVFTCVALIPSAHCIYHAKRGRHG